MPLPPAPAAQLEVAILPLTSNDAQPDVPANRLSVVVADTVRFVVVTFVCCAPNEPMAAVAVEPVALVKKNVGIVRIPAKPNTESGMNPNGIPG